jgi:pSer/pThr/pTyr-binding forkhead associated (FHA) protein
MGGTTPEPAPAKVDATFGFWLVMPSGQIPLIAGDNVIGRDPNARVWLDSPSVSRRHAIIHVTDEGATLEDLGSKNGTHLRDMRVSRIMPLADGDALRFGSVGATFRFWAADPTRTGADPS